MSLSLTEIVKELSISYPNIVKERDSMRVAVFLRDFVEQLRLNSVLLTQQQAILTLDDNFRAELPAGIDKNGRIIVSVCVCGELFTIDLQNKSCPTNVKTETCACSDPDPCDCEAGCLCNCNTCGNTIGYAYGYQFGDSFYGGIWGNYAYYPIGRVNGQNPYGNARIEGNNIIFSSHVTINGEVQSLQGCDIYILYEELQDAGLTEISKFWRQGAQYYVLSKFYQEIDPNKATYFDSLATKQIYLNKKKIFRGRINYDTLRRVNTSKNGVIKLG